MTVRALLFALVLLAGCTDESSARDSLDAQGFTDIVITGWEPFSCGEDDDTSTGFTAINSNGEPVEGVVCCGFVFKGCTIRW